MLEALLSPTGTIDTVLNRICFTPAIAGTYPIIVRVTDACGEFGADTLNVTVTFNRPPVVDAGADGSSNLCSPTEICLPITVTDLDNNVDSVKLIAGAGLIVSGQHICFVPDTSGVYRFIVRIVDRCGASDDGSVFNTVI